jgi:hypothetical protein
VDYISFEQPDRAKTIAKIQDLSIYGKPLNSKRNLACSVCGGSTLPLGRLAWPGAPLCRRESCEMSPISEITDLFITPYGRALTIGILRIFCLTLEKEKVLVQRQPLIERADVLVDGYIDLLRWQKAFHDVDRLTNPRDYALGRVSIVPPRRLDEVLTFRATAMPSSIDPTALLPEDLSMTLHRVRERGPRALEVPF